MKNKCITRFIAVLLGLMVLFFVAVDPAGAQSNNDYTVEIRRDEHRPWAGKPWVVGLILSAGAVFIALKNAKRSHLD